MSVRTSDLAQVTALVAGLVALVGACATAFVQVRGALRRRDAAQAVPVNSAEDLARAALLLAQGIVAYSGPERRHDPDPNCPHRRRFDDHHGPSPADEPAPGASRDAPAHRGRRVGPDRAGRTREPRAESRRAIAKPERDGECDDA